MDVTQYLGLAISEAAKYIPMIGDDAVGVANLALVEASHSFDPSKGIAFPSWAAIKIRYALLDAVNDSRMIRVPRPLYKPALRYAEARDEMRAEGLDPAPEEVFDRLGEDMSQAVVDAAAALGLKRTHEAF